MKDRSQGGSLRPLQKQRHASWVWGIGQSHDEWGGEGVPGTSGCGCSSRLADRSGSTRNWEAGKGKSCLHCSCLVRCYMQSAEMESGLQGYPWYLYYNFSHAVFKTHLCQAFPDLWWPFCKFAPACRDPAVEYVTCNPHALSKEHYLAKEYVMNEKNQFIFKRSMAVMGEVSNLLIAFFVLFCLN